MPDSQIRLWAWTELRERREEGTQGVRECCAGEVGFHLCPGTKEMEGKSKGEEACAG